MNKKEYSIAELAEVLGISGDFDETRCSGRLTRDSRTVEAGDIFVAIAGGTSDGHEYITAALEQGAACVVYDADGTVPERGVKVTDSRIAWSQLSAWNFRYPAGGMHTVGVTGTNGKTTIQWIISQLLQELKGGVLRVGTLGAVCSSCGLDEESLTTPDAFDLQRYCSLAVDSGTQFAVFEVSSHALCQHRVDTIPFNGAVFSNLSRDHLDYHETEEAYFAAKKKLFELCASHSGSDGYAVICTDTEEGRQLASEFEGELRILRYGVDDNADYRITEFEQSFQGCRFQLVEGDRSFSIESSYIGLHNARNLAAGFAVLRAIGVSGIDIVTALKSATVVPGRLESVGTTARGVFVDYAHTPDALDNVLQYVKPLVSGRLLVLFGCGGDRDRGKRPQMAASADRWADIVCVSSDNPRTEDPQRIIDDILSEGLQPGMVEVDRRAAILKSLAMMEDGDVLVIAGKGHEDYQILGTEKIHFSDQEIVRDYFKSVS